jgi:T-complex protein 1 subunit beta
VGALALGDLVKSTLGPKGMNKILQSMSTGDINVTNDGATILKAIQLDNAAAKILVNISKVQDDEVGDGTTSVTVLAAELLREAEKLIGLRIHPQTIVEGYRIASVAALKALEGAAVDNGYVANLFFFFSFWFGLTIPGVYLSRSDAATFRKDLVNIARTTLSSKVLSQDKSYFSNLAVDAVLRLKVRVPQRAYLNYCYSWLLQGSTDLDHIQIIKKVGGKLTDSYLDEG